MRFYLFDAVSEFVSGEKAVGIKNVSAQEEFLINHFDRCPIMPPPLIIESLAQLGGWTVTVSGGIRHLAVMVMIKGVKITGDAVPGDRIVLNVHLENVNEYGAGIRAEACVNGTPIISIANITYVLYEIPDAEKDAVKDKYLRLAGEVLS